MKKIILALILLTGVLLLNSCGFSGESEDTQTKGDAISRQTEAPSDTAELTNTDVVCHLDDALEKNKSDFTHVESIVIDKEGREMLFWAEQKLDSVKLAAVSYDDSSDSYIENNILFETEALKSGEALSVTAYLPDAMANLRISFSFAGENHAYLLADSGKDGSLLLLPDEG